MDSVTIKTQQLIETLFKDKITVVIPTLNEAGAIGKVIDELKANDYRRILVVDGYSTDSTAEIAELNGGKVVHQHGAGKAGAVKTALELVETPYVVFIDGDYTYDPADIWRLLNHSDRYSHVIGSRNKKQIGRIHRFGNWVIAWTFSMLFAMKVTDVCSGLYLLETEEARKYNLEEHGFVAEIELAAQSASAGSLTEVPISYRPRIGKEKLNTWRHGLEILYAAFKLARRYNPVLLYSGLAGLLVIPGSLVLLYVLLERLSHQTWHQGWALIGVMTLVVGAQAFTLASLTILTKNSERRLMEELKRLRKEETKRAL